MEVLRIYYKLNALNSSYPEDIEWIYRNAHRPGFEKGGFGRECVRFEAILEMKNHSRTVLFRNYQKILIELV